MADSGKKNAKSNFCVMATSYFCSSKKWRKFVSRVLLLEQQSVHINLDAPAQNVPFSPIAQSSRLNSLWERMSLAIPSLSYSKGSKLRKYFLELKAVGLGNFANGDPQPRVSVATWKWDKLHNTRDSTLAKEERKKERPSLLHALFPYPGNQMPKEGIKERAHDIWIQAFIASVQNQTVRNKNV